MKKVGMFLVGFMLASSAFAKGFLAKGTYEGKTLEGKLISLTFEEVLIDSTTTVITDCKIEMEEGSSICGRVNKIEIEKVPAGQKIKILDYLVTNETFDRGFGVTFGFVGPRRVVYSAFNLFIENPEDLEMTFSLATPSNDAEKVILKKVN